MNEEIDSRVQAQLFSRYPFQKGFHVLLEVQAWIRHAEKVRSIFQDFCYSTIFSFSACRISTGVSTLGMILGSALIAF